MSRVQDTWDSRQLHVFLHRACEPLLPIIREHVVHEDGARFAALILALRTACRAGLDVPTLARALREHRAEAVVALAAALKLLDAHHAAQREVHYARVELPGGPLGPLYTLLLPAPRTPIQDLVEEVGRGLDRPASYHEQRLDDLLGLRLRLVHLDRLAPIPRVEPVPARVAVALEARLPDLRVAIASPLADLPLTAEGRPLAPRSDQKVPFRLVSLSPEADRGLAQAALRDVVSQCHEQQIDLLILPELCLPPEQLEQLRAALRAGPRRHPALVVAGSWHVPRADGRWVNRCEVLDGAGRTLWTHDKCTVYDIPARTAAAMDPALRQMLGIDERGGVEEIEVGTELRLLDGPWGRMAVLVCKDFISEDARAQLKETGANLLLVPAMSERTDPFEERAREWGSLNRAVSFVANSAWMLERMAIAQRGEVAVAYAYLPGRSTSRRWAAGERWVMFTIRQLFPASPPSDSDKMMNGGRE